MTRKFGGEWGVGSREWGIGNRELGELRNSPLPTPHSPLPGTQNVNFAASCNWRGSPTPWRRKPSKLNSPGVVSGLIRFLLLKVLNISMVGMIEKRSLKRKAFDRRQSNEKYLLSLRNELRLVAVRGPGPHGAVSVW